MGLRIIGRRPPKPPVEVTEAELLQGLEQESASWPTARGYQSVEVQRRFMEKFRSVKARLTTLAEVTACAERVQEQLHKRVTDSASTHSQVDVATLLELL